MHLILILSMWLFNYPNTTYSKIWSSFRMIWNVALIIHYTSTCSWNYSLIFPFVLFVSPHALTSIYFKYKGCICFHVQPGKPNSILFFIKVLLSIHAYLFCQMNFIILTRWLSLENNLMIFYWDYITCNKSTYRELTSL